MYIIYLNFFNNLRRSGASAGAAAGAVVRPWALPSPTPSWELPAEGAEEAEGREKAGNRSAVSPGEPCRSVKAAWPDRG